MKQKQARQRTRVTCKCDCISRHPFATCQVCQRVVKQQLKNISSLADVLVSLITDFYIDRGPTNVKEWIQAEVRYAVTPFREQIEAAEKTSRAAVVQRRPHITKNCALLSTS